MKIIIWIALVIAVSLLAVRYIERQSIFFPMRKITGTPAAIGLAYEEIFFRTADAKQLHGWFIPCDGAKFTLLFCHGNAGNIGHRLDKIAILLEMGLNIFIFDYRGYGNSQGTPSEKGLYQDGRAAYLYLINEKKIKEQEIILYGESIGSAVIIEVALRQKPRALITEEAFTSAKAMARLVFPFLPSAIFSSQFHSLSKIRNITCPKLIIHSRDDEIVPFAMGTELFNASQPPKRFVELRGDHNAAFLKSGERYRKEIRSFIIELSS